jgi:hypothetical protein
MFKNKPTKKNNKPKAKKLNRRKSWFKVAKKTHELNKKNKLGWTWSESMRFASQKVYPKFKGLPSNKISVKDIINQFKSEIDISKEPIPKEPIPKEKPIKICDDVRQIPDDFLVDLNDFYTIANEEIWSIFTSNMPMRFAFDGIIDTGIIPKNLMPDMTDIREKMRKLYGNASPVPQFIFKRLIQPNKIDDNNPCSYYILVTMLDGSYDASDDKEILSDNKLTEEQKLEIEKAKKIERKSKKSAKERKRPTEVEPKSITKAKGESQKGKLSQIDKEIQLEKLKVKKSSNLTEALKLLRKNFDDGLITKRQFRDANKKLLDRFEKGGEL